MKRVAQLVAALIAYSLSWTLARGDATVFFRACQSEIPVSSQVTSDTTRSNGILFTFTRDKLFTGGTGEPIGRPVRIAWPEGVEAQAVTTPPPGVTDQHARIILQRADGQPFDLTSFTAKLLANTAGAGGTIEIMPKLNGEDGFADPLPFDATGVYGQTFSYDTSPNPLGSTALLVGFDTYDIALYVDFALVALTLNSGAPGERSCCFVNGSCSDLTSSACALLGGASQAAGTSCACEPCAPSGPPPAPDGTAGTQPLRGSRATPAGDAIDLTWDAVSCPAAGYNLLFGGLDGVAVYALGGAECALGTSGTFGWTAVPTGNLWFLIVGTDGAATESSWGLDSHGQERNGPSASAACGVTAKDPARACP